MKTGGGALRRNAIVQLLACVAVALFPTTDAQCDDLSPGLSADTYPTISTAAPPTCIVPGAFKGYTGDVTLTGTMCSALKYIGEESFWGMAGKLTIQCDLSALTHIRKYAFVDNGNSQTTSVVDLTTASSLITVGSGAFNSFKGIITMTGSYLALISIEASAFKNADNSASSIDLSTAQQLTAIRKLSFFNYVGVLYILGNFDKLEIIEFDAFKIEGGADANPSSKIQLTSASSLASIDSGAFQGFPGIIKIGQSANLISLVGIQYDAFLDAGTVHSLIQLSMAHRLREIESGAFKNFKGQVEMHGHFPALEKVAENVFTNTGGQIDFQCRAYKKEDSDNALDSAFDDAAFDSFLGYNAAKDIACATTTITTTTTATTTTATTTTSDVFTLEDRCEDDYSACVGCGELEVRNGCITSKTTLSKATACRIRVKQDMMLSVDVHTMESSHDYLRLTTNTGGIQPFDVKHYEHIYMQDDSYIDFFADVTGRSNWEICTTSTMDHHASECRDYRTGCGSYGCTGLEADVSYYEYSADIFEADPTDGTSAMDACCACGGGGTLFSNVHLGAKNDVPSTTYNFMIMQLLFHAETDTTGSALTDQMIDECKRVDMKPVCDDPDNCNNGLYIGQSGRISDPDQNGNEDRFPGGWVAIGYAWDKLCGYTTAAYDNHPSCGRTESFRPSFMCGKAVITTTSTTSTVTTTTITTTTITTTTHDVFTFENRCTSDECTGCQGLEVHHGCITSRTRPGVTHSCRIKVKKQTMLSVDAGIFEAGGGDGLSVTIDGKRRDFDNEHAYFTMSTDSHIDFFADESGRSKWEICTTSTLTAPGSKCEDYPETCDTSEANVEACDALMSDDYVGDPYFEDYFPSVDSLGATVLDACCACGGGGRLFRDIPLGGQNGVAPAAYNFMILQLSNTKTDATDTELSDQMIDECNRFGMLPVCDRPGACTGALYIGQNARISGPLDESVDLSTFPNGWSTIRFAWDKVCGYTTAGYDDQPLCVPTDYYRPRVMCGKALITTVAAATKDTLSNKAIGGIVGGVVGLVVVVGSIAFAVKTGRWSIAGSRTYESVVVF